MIEKVITTSRTTEINDLTSRVVGAFKKTGLSSDAHLSSLITGLENDVARLIAAIKRMKIESELEEQDEFRDDAMRALYYLVLGLLYHPDTEIKAAAQKVFKVIEHYGLSVVGESYATESSLVNSMLDDLKKANLQEAIAVLSGCAELIAEVQTTEDRFEDTRIAYEEGKGLETTLASATVIKKQLTAQINQKLVVYLRAMEQVDVETYGSFARTVAEIIANNNEGVKKRRQKTEPAE